MGNLDFTLLDLTFPLLPNGFSPNASVAAMPPATEA